ncbi:MAG: SMP-30/gluconolactonase/LRE family protein [Planctomycetota bacterium]|nr:SMP-30/gluconolactonase/LRE family protein [Planctomycetota bacterium]
MRYLSAVVLTVMIFGDYLLSAESVSAADGARLKLEGKVAFVEGPVWHPSGNVYFSDIPNNRIMRRDRTGAIHVYRTPSGYTNGLCFDLEGRLICCEGGGVPSNRQVTRIEKDGTITVLADSFEGKRVNSPNDCTIDSKGRIYFTDPRYRSRVGLEQFDADGREIEGVYRIDDVGQVARILTHEVERPNGIAISPDEKFLFVTDNKNDGADGNRKLWRFDLKANGTVEAGSRKLLFDWERDRGPDGMAVDSLGRLYVTAGFNYPDSPEERADKYKAGVYVISQDGQLVHFIPVPTDMISNCAFGDPDLKTLYITAGHRLWSIRNETAGHVEWLRKK